ncbi:MAG TPA: PilN domain-containing protein [Desulfuromonadaceae bacterium]|jgi:hypothetical protein
MRYTINLATRSYLDYRRVNQILILLITLLLALLAWNVSRFSMNLGELSSLKADSAAYEGRLNNRPAGVSEKDYTRMLESIRYFNGILEKKSYPWLLILEQLERATPEGVALVSLTPDKKNGELVIEGRAKNFTIIRSYLDKLEDSKAFQNILLQSHHVIAMGEKVSGIQFRISCQAVMR